MSNIFKKLEKEALSAGIPMRTREASTWFKNRVRSIQSINRQELMKEKRLEKSSESPIGSMVMFFYDPKTKDTLPFYDKFPLSIILGPMPGGFAGLNLHYLPPALRARLLDDLIDVTNNKRYDTSTKFKVTYQLLNSATKLKYFKPCYKHYLNSHVRSNFAIVQPKDWEIATFLPTASWSKANSNDVWRESRRIINVNN